jgi:CheY-like chemotaxis protein
MEPALAPRDNSESILVVDDEATVRLTIRKALESYGYHVLEAPDGAEALEVFSKEQDRIGLVVLDIVMPGMSGLDVLAKLKSLAPTVPVVLVSGYTWTGAPQANLVANADAFLRKPFELTELSGTVQRLLAKQPDNST